MWEDQLKFLAATKKRIYCGFYFTDTNFKNQSAESLKDESLTLATCGFCFRRSKCPG